MRLLILSSEFPPGPGGIGTHAWQISSQLSKLGWEVTVISRQDYATKPEIASFNATQPLRVVRLRKIPFAPLEAAYRLGVVIRRARAWDPDVIIASGERSVWIAAVVAGLRRVPWVAIGHGTEFGTKRGWERALNERAFSRASAVVCVSEYTRSRMHTAGISGRREVVIPNGADPEQFSPAPATTARGAATKFTLLTVGNVTKRKGQDIVVRALPHLPGVRYEMVGLPTRREEVAALARELGVEDRVEFVGRSSQEDLQRRMRSCDVFVMTSRNTADGDFEGFGIAVVEAALCGKPSVVSAGSGLAEAIVAGDTGLLVREDDPEDVARAVRELLDDAAKRHRMGEAARRRATSEQTWKRRAERYDQLLHDLLRPEGKRLVVISDTPHYRRGGVIVGWGPTVRELDQLSSLFDELVHVAPFNEGSAPVNALPYMSPRVRVRVLRAAGGEHIADKIRVFRAMPGYVAAALDEMRGAVAVQLRCPAAISMAMAFLLPLLRHPRKRWIKYAGNWNPSGEEPWTYEMQRRWLGKRWHRAVVTVNGDWPQQPPWIKEFPNPCLTDKELESGAREAIAKEYGYPLKLLFVGRLEPQKGVWTTMDVVTQLHRRGFSIRLDLVGDGPSRLDMERVARERRIDHIVRFHGWLPHGKLGPRYRDAHLMLFPSHTEGWPKVLSEGMAYGVVPVASRVSSIPQYLVRFGVGTVAEPTDVVGFVTGVLGYMNDPARLRSESARAVRAAAEFTYGSYLDRVRALLELNTISRTEMS